MEAGTKVSVVGERGLYGGYKGQQGLVDRCKYLCGGCKGQY